MRVASGMAVLLGTSCMSGTPAATMRAMNSSGSIVSEVAFTVSMKDAAEYCKAQPSHSLNTTDGKAWTWYCRQLVMQCRPAALRAGTSQVATEHTGCCMVREDQKTLGTVQTSCVKK